MRRTIALLISLLAIVPLAAGCGSEDEFSVSAAEAADATVGTESARATMKMQMSGLGLPLPMTVSGKGVTAMSEPRMDITFDFGSLVQMAGGSGDGRTRMVLDGKRLYVDPPAIEGLKLPGGKQWVTADLTKVLGALGIDASGFGALMRMTPEQQIGALKAAGSIKEVGKEEIGGAETVHLKGTVKASDYLKGLPADQREAAEKAIAELEKLPGGENNKAAFDSPMPVDLWVDEDKHIRRMVQTAKIPGQQGQPGGEMKITLDLSDFGTALDVAAPDRDDVYDATADLSRALKSIPAGAGGTATG